MIQKVFVGFLLLVSIIAATRGQGSTTTRKIFQPPGDSTIDQIKGTSTPWVLPEFISIINEFKENVFEDLQASSEVQKIWNITTESKETRNIFFKLLNKFLDDLGHPAPAALANIASKAGSRFDPLDMPTIFESVAVHVAEFFLSKDMKIERETATRYADSISHALESADLNIKESVWQAILDGYGNFLLSYELNLVDVIDELLQLFASELVVLHEK